ncbi:alpha/beta hydrolase, partial [Micromonospora sp. WMMD736]|uniref:alpha/beta hydrolase n=1 Tax=Micromonospora sp. WMMD736 TaxID=3404112 RepID=UPI003B965987
WVFGGLNSHRGLTSRVSSASGMPVLALQYRMVPSVSLEQEVQDCLRGYKWLLEQGLKASNIVVMGDSAGGYLTLATALRIRSLRLPMPAALVGISGVYDMSSAARAAHPNAARDRGGFLAGLDWLLKVVLGDLDSSDPAVSPMRAELSGLPPTLLTASSSEIVFCDSERLASQLASAGVPCELQVWVGQPHVFQLLAPVIPEASRSISEIGHFVRVTVGSARDAR